MVGKDLLNVVQKAHIKKNIGVEFPGGPVVRTLHFHCKVPSLVGELRSHKLPSVAKTNKQKNTYARKEVSLPNRGEKKKDWWN